MKEIRKNDAELKEQPAVDVVIDGKVIPLSGGETEYLQRVAGYLDGKISELKRPQQYGHQNAEQRSMTLSLNLADDCMRARHELQRLKSESEAHESEVYVLKRELVEKRIETERMKERLTASEEARKEIAKQLYELSGQRKKVEEQAQELDRLRERLQQAEQRAKELKTRADALEQEVNELLEK